MKWTCENRTQYPTKNHTHMLEIEQQKRFNVQGLGYYGRCHQQDNTFPSTTMILQTITFSGLKTGTQLSKIVEEL